MQKIHLAGRARQECLQGFGSLDGGRKKKLQEQLRSSADRYRVLVGIGGRPLRYFNARGLLPHEQRGTGEANRLLSADSQRQVAGQAEIELDESIPSHQLDARRLVGKVLDDHVALVADACEIPVALP